MRTVLNMTLVQTKVRVNLNNYLIRSKTRCSCEQNTLKLNIGSAACSLSRHNSKEKEPAGFVNYPPFLQVHGKTSEWNRTNEYIQTMILSLSLSHINRGALAHLSIL